MSDPVQIPPRTHENHTFFLELSMLETGMSIPYSQCTFGACPGPEKMVAKLREIWNPLGVQVISRLGVHWMEPYHELPYFVLMMMRFRYYGKKEEEMRFANLVLEAKRRP